MSDFDWSDAFEVHNFEFDNGKSVRTIYLRECPAGEYIDNRTDILEPAKKGSDRQVDVDKAQAVLYDNAAKSVCSPSGELVFKSGAEAKAKMPEAVFKFVCEKMKVINRSAQIKDDEGNSAD